MIIISIVSMCFVVKKKVALTTRDLQFSATALPRIYNEEEQQLLGKGKIDAKKKDIFA